MPVINILSREVSELIAAGEVVERPASVIKELVENCVDAGAKQVTIEIMGGGVSFMRVTDDGCGIAFGEVPKAFMRHATSKTQSKEDLESIVTMGFRGEALASVAAVSKIEILTKRAGDSTGTLYRIHGGEETAYREAGCPDGTTIIIRELFYNTPARLKFLKKDVSEANAVAAVIDKLILAHEHIGFRFIRDNKPVRITAGDGSLYSALYSVFGKQFAASLAPVDFTQGCIKITGFVSSPLFCRGNRTMQYFFLNSRPVKSVQIMAALEEAYRNTIPIGKYPACALKIQIDSAQVDVNVHPAKTEVRFADDNAVFDTVYFAVKNALLNAQSIKEIEVPKPEQQTPRPPEYRVPSEPEQPAVQQDLPLSFAASKTEYVVGKALPPEPPRPQYTYIKSESIISARPAAPENPQANQDAPLRIIGELWRTYILCDDGEALILIDKHAAHERIRFEILKAEFSGSSQLLAESIYIYTDPQEYDALKQGTDILLDAGIEVIPINDNRIEVIALPTILTGCDIAGILLYIADIFMKSGGSELGTEGIFNEVLHSIACKSSIRAGDRSVPDDLEQLARKILADNTIRFCPHGRPVVTRLSRHEIEKNFGRL